MPMRKPSYFLFILLLLSFFLGNIVTGCEPVSVLHVGIPTFIPTIPRSTESLPTTPPILDTKTVAPAEQTATQELSSPKGSERSTDIPTGTAVVTEMVSPSSTFTKTTTPYTYFFPVQPPSLASFSEGVASHGYPATDIFAPEGTQVVSVINGVIDFVSFKDVWDPKLDDPATRGGLSVAIIGDDGVRYYGSHLSAIQAGIAPGIRVAGGQLLGYVGHTGDARNTESHLHFGISRPTFADDWKIRRGQVDPYAYLFAWRSGLDLTPGLPSP
jgi:murein DD-endopeptidase MepM/ murein hydrolase activator NlpD